MQLQQAQRENSFKLNITCLLAAQSCMHLSLSSITAFYWGEPAPVRQSCPLFMSMFMNDLSFAYVYQSIYRWIHIIHTSFFSPLQLCLGALYQPLSGCIRLPCPGALDPVCDPTTLTPFPFSFLSPCPKLLPTCPPPHSCCGPPASRPACRGRGPWCHGSLQWTQPPRHEQRDPSGGQGSEVELHPASLQTLQLACTLPAGQSHLSF